MRKLLWTPDAWDDYLSWQNDKKTFKKINNLIKEILRHPTTGTGKPEALKEDLSGYWSRRINDKDRLVYSFTDDAISIYSCKNHYTKR